jgi:hypothetical protein
MTTGRMTAAELRATRVDLLDQLVREPAVLEALEQAIRTRDLATSDDILHHLRDLVTVLHAWVQCTTVGDDPPPPVDPAA